MLQVQIQTILMQTPINLMPYMAFKAGVPHILYILDSIKSVNKLFGQQLMTISQQLMLVSLQVWMCMLKIEYIMHLKRQKSLLPKQVLKKENL